MTLLVWVKMDPTHQPVEQVNALRTTPDMTTWRPCDQVETAVAWKAAVEKNDGPTSLILSRQALPQQLRNKSQLADIQKGGYILSGCKEPQLILIATGSEIELARAAAEELTHQGIKVRVVSMPSPDTFASQCKEYRDSVLPPAVKNRIAIEAGVTDGWYRFVGLDGEVIGIDRFGESAPAAELFKLFGFTVDNVVKVSLDLMNRK